MSLQQTPAGIVGPFDGLDVPWLLRMRAEVRRDHPFLIWAPFDAPARRWSYGEFHERVGALAAGLARRGVKPGEYVLIHLDNCIEALLAWFACVELGAIAVTTNTRSAPAEIAYFADHCGAVARDHAAGLCGDRRAELPQHKLDGGDLARCGGGAGARRLAGRQF
ncbi:acyl-CoA synthetase (AMP-forming)/AMP-acid ligase II [Bradyrhizobium ottawaense]